MLPRTPILRFKARVAGSWLEITRKKPGFIMAGLRCGPNTFGCFGVFVMI